MLRLLVILCRTALVLLFFICVVDLVVILSPLMPLLPKQLLSWMRALLAFVMPWLGITPIAGSTWFLLVWTPKVLIALLGQVTILFLIFLVGAGVLQFGAGQADLLFRRLNHRSFIRRRRKE